MKKVLLTILIATSTAFGQTKQSEKNTRNDLRYDLNSSGSHYIKATFLNQTWLRLNENNPGTTVLGDPAENTFDIGLRRTRLQLFGQLTDRVFFYTQFGMNNFNKISGYPSGNRKVQPFFHDALAEYEVHRKGDNFVRFGGGLTIVNGLSRFTQPSIGTILTMDVPVFAQATVEESDQFARKLSVYSRGQLGPLNYRLAVSDPFPVESNGKSPAPITSHSVYALKKHKKQFQGLFIYNFFDTESLVAPGYMTGTYLGKKKVLNLEAGFISQKNATWRSVGNDTVYNHMNLWSVSVFADLPLNTSKGTSISGYLGYFNTDYGKGYLRYNGIMNPGSGTQSALGGVSSTQGNAFPMFGTGHVLYAQAGYKFRDDLLGEQGTLMPYISLQHADYDRINGSMDVFNVGVNWLLQGHTSKISLNYENRPVYVNDRDPNYLKKSGTKGSFVLQYQISI